MRTRAADHSVDIIDLRVELISRIEYEKAQARKGRERIAKMKRQLAALDEALNIPKPPPKRPKVGG